MAELAPAAASPAPPPPSSSSSSPSTSSSSSSSAASKEFDIGFPLHCVVTAGEWLIAAGGGGEANTGITNGLVVFRWEKHRLAKVLTHSTGTSTFHRLALHPSEPLCAGVTLHGELLVFSFGQGGVKTRDGKETGSGVSTDVKLVVFAKQGDEIATVDSKDQLRTLAFPSLRTQNSWAGPAATSDLAISPAGDFLYALCDKEVRVYSRAGQELSRLDKPLGEGAVFRALGCSGDGRLVVSAMRKPVGGRGATRKAGASFVQLYDVAVVAEKRGQLRAYGKCMKLSTHHTCMGVSQDGRFVALGTDEGGVNIFRTDYYSVANAARMHEWVVSGVCFDPTSRAVASSSVAYTIKVHKVFPQSRSYFNIVIAALFLVLLYYIFATFVQPTVMTLLGIE